LRFDNERKTFLAKKGEWFLWHGLMIHGGDAIRNPSLTPAFLWYATYIPPEMNKERRSKVRSTGRSSRHLGGRPPKKGQTISPLFGYSYRMPELPDIVVYVEALQRRISGSTLHQIRLSSAFLVRTVDPPISSLNGKRLLEIRRLGKRIVFVFDDEHYLVLHLMIAGRLQWMDRTSTRTGRKHSCGIRIRFRHTPPDGNRIEEACIDSCGSRGRSLQVNG
jgi:hypothetical protein